ncbi:hypothetical protein KMI_02g02980 [Encephalitozoon hellem]|uniref:Uncharacterized protein n=1 Tax=Encephalitozoon hellem TaxID=27973 RepID=A0A9Q9F8W6_ENCHE|nr:uncharacterized protein EHEL_100440 [Encephalitozoon hellem ATCC 50504]AFM99138.1 hypothetical protein EHEL_100440 [Encephalitozoon hellem ATCC 50504]KAG5860207.1 hypothetical protein KMI_02g02980 [Encephalitozoon hellem]UTX44124.1 hypothetical protein GPU96_10g19130 [Encephalitozoon hellem]|eukprot:XP_003888119.1 hypothetical protein EHEL_100440 [Encephalitozoon hellem ATCC 50504]
MGGEWKSLRIEHDLSHERIIEWEKIIKQHIRQNSLNLETENEIERYSDRYFKSRLSEDMIKEIVDGELMPPEISRIFGERREKKMEDIGEIESSAEEEITVSEEIENSGEIENDYVDNFYEDEDELTEEKNEEGFF